MKSKLISKAIAAVLLGILLGISVLRQMQKHREPQREAFMEQQEQRWNRETRVHNVSPAIFSEFVLVTAVCLAAVIFGLYELMAAIICLGLRKLFPHVDDPKPFSGTPSIQSTTTTRGPLSGQW